MRHVEWLNRGVPQQLVSAYEYCISASAEHEDDHDQASQVLIELIASHLTGARS